MPRKKRVTTPYEKPQQNELGQFVKGNNAYGGDTKQLERANAIRKLLPEVFDVDSLREIFTKIRDLAIGGNQWACEWVGERTLGKVPQISIFDRTERTVTEVEIRQRFDQILGLDRLGELATAGPPRLALHGPVAGEVPDGEAGPARLPEEVGSGRQPNEGSGEGATVGLHLDRGAVERPQKIEVSA